MKVALIDYGAGNLRSVANALRALGVRPGHRRLAGGSNGATHLVLPGVGSFGDCMAQLEGRGLVPAIRDWVAAGKPYLGICLGYQILFESSEETPGVAGLGTRPGQGPPFQTNAGPEDPAHGMELGGSPESGIRKLGGPRCRTVFLLRAFVFSRAGRR